MKDTIKTPKNVMYHNAISCSTTWIDGRIIFKLNEKHSKFYYGICSFSRGIFAVTPSDYKRPTMIASIQVSPIERYCERAFSCLNFTCKLNQFDKGIFIDEFKDCGAFTLGLPRDIEKKPQWFSVGEFKDYWGKFIIPQTGGVLKYKEK